MKCTSCNKVANQDTSLHYVNQKGYNIGVTNLFISVIVVIQNWMFLVFKKLDVSCLPILDTLVAIFLFILKWNAFIAIQTCLLILLSTLPSTIGTQYKNLFLF